MNTLFFASLASFFVCAGIVIALVLAFSLFRHRQPMKIMNAVWILTALWAHYFALFAYYTFGMRWEDMAGPSTNHRHMNMGFKTDASMPMEMPMTINMDAERPRWQSITLSTLHCGAGCTLADLTGELFTAYGSPAARRKSACRQLGTRLWAGFVVWHFFPVHCYPRDGKHFFFQSPRPRF